MPTILIVEDDADNRNSLAQALGLMGYKTVAVDSGEAALCALDAKPDIPLVICDIRLPGIDGIALGHVVRQRHPSVKIILVTGGPDAAEKAIQNDVIAMLKPYDFNLLTPVIVETLGNPSET
jgi:DNA-binding NtrC family response regulator